MLPSSALLYGVIHTAFGTDCISFLPALAGQPSCNEWQRHKSLLCCHHSKVIRFALPGTPVCLYIFSLSVVGYKTKQTGQHLLDMRSGRVPRISLCGLGVGLEEQKKALLSSWLSAQQSVHEEIGRHPFLCMQKSLCSVNKKHCEKQSFAFLI